MTEQTDNPARESTRAPEDARTSDAPQSSAGASDSGVDDAAVDDAASLETDPQTTDPLAEAKAELVRMREQLLRTAADFDNFRKRSRREAVDAELRGREAFMREVLPVFDNLERAVAHAGVATDVQSLLNGIQMVVRQFADTLMRLGIERVSTVGTQFDPMVHEAIQHLETDAYLPGVIAAEIQGGYLVQKRLIRPAMVVVAKAKKADDADAAKPPSETAAASPIEVTEQQPTIVTEPDPT